MVATLGPKFAFFAEAPLEWNEASLVESGEVALRLGDDVAYVVDVPSKEFRQKLISGGKHWVYLGHIIREDAETFFAFATPLERALFIQLRELDSIGPKLAASAVCDVGFQALLQMCEGGRPPLAKIPGFGPKTLERLASGLKVNKDKFLKLLSLGMSTGPTSLHGARGGNEDAIFVEALVKMGLKHHEVAALQRRLSEEVEGFSKLPVTQKVKQGLQRWSQLRGNLKT